MKFNDATKVDFTRRFLFSPLKWDQIAKDFAMEKKLTLLLNDKRKMNLFGKSLQKMGRRFYLDNRELFDATGLPNSIYEEPVLEEEVHEVAEILHHRNDKNGKTEYLVEWTNYAETNWVCEDNLKECQDSIELYKKTINK